MFVQLNLFLNPELPEGDYGFTTVFGAIGEGEEPSSLDIFVMDVADLDGDGNGDNLTRLTNVQGFDGRSAWHPSGNQIAFCTERVGFGDFEIFVMDAVDTDGDGNGENPTQLTNAPGFSCSPDWMDRIVFHSNRDGQRNIYVMDPVDTDGDGNGENLIRLTDNGVDDSLPAWSPDLSRIAFNSNRGDGVRHIYVMDAVDNDGDGNGDNLFRLTVGPERVVGADWSPDGSRIAFAWIRDGNFEIFVMDAADLDGDGNGDNLTRLTTNEAGDFFAAWSPDGNQIAFDSNRDGNREIYVMDAADVDGDGNGDNLIRMTTSEADDGVPAWSPDGSRIAFRSDR